MDKEIIDEIIDMLIEEAKENPAWKAENALRCTKKMLLRNKKVVMPNECNTEFV